MTGSAWTQPFHWTPENTERLRDLWDRGLTGYEIAEIFCVTRNKVMGKLNRLGKLDGSRPHTPWAKQRHRESVRKPWREYKQIARAKVTKPLKASQGSGRRISVPPIADVAPPPYPEPRPSPWSGLAGEIDVLTANDCRWPLGGAYEPPTVFCKAPINGTKGSYCLYHAQIAFRPAGIPQEPDDNPKGIKGTFRQWRPLDMGGSKR